MKKKNYYLDKIELYNELSNYKKTGWMSDRLGLLFITLCDHILNHSNFRNYSLSLKDDMKSHALLLLCRYIHNVDTDKRNPSNTLAYVNTTIFNAYKLILNDHYKQVNLKRELIHKMLSEFSSTYKIITDDKFEEYD